MARSGAMLCIFLSLAVSCARAEGLGALIEVGKAQAEIQRAYDEETKAFERVRDAIERGAIKKGDDKKDILREYGEPVVILKDNKNNREKWVYKPASSSFFKGVRINIFFGSDGAVDEMVREEP
jgi:hypothetical protein